MIYQQRDNKRKKKARTISVVIIFSIALIIILLNAFAPHLLSPVVHAADSPLSHSRNVVSGGIGGFFELLKSKQALVAENNTLRQEIATYNALEAERRALNDENIALKALCGSGEVPKDIVLAQILSKPGYSPYDTIVVDVGSADGVKVGNFVIVDHTVVIGEVTSVFAHTSNVVLYSSADQKVDVFIGPKALETSAVGKGGGSFEIKLPRNADVHEGDAITLAKHPTHVFGTIMSITSSETDSFEEILFRSAVDINQVRYVTIEKTP